MPQGPKTTHPTYGMIGASRVTCGPGGVYLFGSRIRHNAFIDIIIRRASHERDLNHDWYHGDEELISVRLSEAQWASFVSSLNTGFGVTCSLQYIGREKCGEVPAPEDSIAQAKHEAREHARKATESLQKAVSRLEQIMQNPKKSELKELLHELKVAVGNFPSNHAYLYKTFEEHVEKVVTDAKATVEAHFTAVATRAGFALEAGSVGMPQIEAAEREEANGR